MTRTESNWQRTWKPSAKPLLSKNWNRFFVQIKTMRFKFWIYRFWIGRLCAQIKENHLKGLESGEVELQEEEPFKINDLIAWDDIEIEDELSATHAVDDDADGVPLHTNEPSKFKSKLSVPLVCSPSIHTILYNICQELTRNLPYTMIE